jgi:hypothetical protein
MALTRVKFNDNVTINGNVGVSTSSFNSKLEVKGPGGNGTVRVIPASADAEASIGYYQDTAGTNMTSRWVAGVGGWGHTNEFTIGNDAAAKLKISTAGYVTTPNQPSFYVKDLAFSSGANSAGTTGTVLHNIGSHYSTGSGRFTVPVAGTYVFYGSVQMFNSGTSTYVDVTFYKNGTQYGIEFVSGKVQSGGHYNDHHTQEGMAVIYCNASDYVNIRATRGARNQTQNVFGGYLIG